MVAHEEKLVKQRSKSSKEHSKTFKSPSDTTIYSPDFRRASHEDISLIEKISNAVESILLDSKRGHSSGRPDNGHKSSAVGKFRGTPQSPVHDVRQVQHTDGKM